MHSGTVVKRERKYQEGTGQCQGIWYSGSDRVLRCSAWDDDRVPGNVQSGCVIGRGSECISKQGGEGDNIKGGEEGDMSNRMIGGETSDE